MERRNGLYRERFARTKIVHPTTSPLEQASEVIKNQLLRTILVADGDVLELAIELTNPKDQP